MQVHTTCALQGYIQYMQWAETTWQQVANTDYKKEYVHVHTFNMTADKMIA